MRATHLPLDNRFLDMGLRLAVGAVFLVAGIAKLPMHSELVETVAAYRVLPFSLACAYVSVLPWIEIVLGSCLISGLFIRFFSVVAILVVASFIVGNAIALSLDAESCACFGELVIVTHRGALILDVLLIIGAVLIFFQRKRLMTLDSRLVRLFWYKRQHSA